MENGKIFLFWRTENNIELGYCARTRIASTTNLCIISIFSEKYYKWKKEKLNWFFRKVLQSYYEKSFVSGVFQQWHHINSKKITTWKDPCYFKSTLGLWLMSKCKIHSNILKRDWARVIITNRNYKLFKTIFLPNFK